MPVVEASLERAWSVSSIAEDEPAVRPDRLGVGPAEQGGAGAADVQVPGGRGRETGHIGRRIMHAARWYPYQGHAARLGLPGIPDRKWSNPRPVFRTLARSGCVRPGKWRSPTHNRASRPRSRRLCSHRLLSPAHAQPRDGPHSTGDPPCPPYGTPRKTEPTSATSSLTGQTGARARRPSASGCCSPPARSQRMGSVEDGTTVSDWHDDRASQHHKHSLYTTVHALRPREAHGQHDRRPGHRRLHRSHAIAAFPAVETVCVVIDAHEAASSPVTRRMMAVAKNRNLPRMIIINKIDDRAGRSRGADRVTSGTSSAPSACP